MIQIIKGTEIMRYDGTEAEFSASTLPSKGWAVYVAPDPEPQPPIVPTQISMRQCQLYLWMMDEGVTLNTINAYVLTMQPLAQIEWDTSSEVWRLSPMVEAMRIMFGWSVEQMDQMFLDASEL